MEALKYLMAAYFHQDWDVDGGHVSDSVASFLDERRELVAACADEIDVLLMQDFAEGELQRQLSAWGCGFRAGDSDEDHRLWLTEIRHQLGVLLSESGTSPPGTS